MIQGVIAAALATVSFALLFGVPKRYYPYCAVIGAAGWLVYDLTGMAGLSVPEATFFASLLVVLLSRFCAVWQRCPVTVFLISGIFPLVPGAGIYWTAYYLVTNQLGEASKSGFMALKVAIAIVMGIVFVFELPQKAFRLKKINKSD